MKHLKLFFALFAMLALGVGNAWGAEVTETIKMKGFGGKTNNGYQDVTVSGTSDAGTAMVAYAYNGSTGQVRGNKTTVAGASVTTSDNSKNWSLYNSEAMAGAIKSITITQTATGSNKFQNQMYVSLGTTTQGDVTAITNAQQHTSLDANTITFDIDPSKGYTYFKLLSTKKFTTGSIAGVEVKVTYETTSGGGDEPVATLTANPTTIDFGTVYQGATVTNKTVAVNFANLTGDVTYSGLSTPFSATGAIAATGDKITISADASTIGEYSQTLTVASTVDSKTAEVTVKMNVVAAPAPTGTFTLHTGALVEGDYVIVDGTNAMNNTVTSNRLQYNAVTISNNEIVDPLAATIWHIAPNGEYWTIYSAAAEKYAASTDTKNQATLAASVSDNAKWTVTKSENTFDFENLARSNGSDPGNKYLRKNASYGFACYASGTGAKLSLYRKAGEKYDVNIASTTNGTVTASPTSAEAGTTIALTVTPDAGYVLDALTVTDASNTVTVTNNEFTMPASDVTVTATFKPNEKPAATLTLIKNGVEETFPGSWKQDDVVTLPTTVDTDCVKEFVGWSADANRATEPEYAPGASYTLASTSQTLYAVYATAGAGETLTITPSAVSGSADPYTFTIDAAGYSLTAKKNGGSTAPTYTSNEVRVYAKGTVTLTAPKAMGTIVFNISTNGKKRLAPITASVGTIATQASGDATVTWTGDATEVTFTVGDIAEFGSENTKAGQLCFGTMTVTTAGSYSAYSTTCSAALANPTFSLAEGKYTEAKSVTISAAEGTIYYTTDGTEPTASSTPYTGAIALNDCGEYTIKAIAISSNSQSDVVSATYTIKLPLTNSQAAPYTEAEAIAVYDGGCYDNQDVYVKGTVKTATFYNSGTYTITLTNGFQFYKFYKDGSKTLFADGEINKGDVLVACGKLSKYNTTYQLAEGCYLVEYEPYTEPKTDISNTEATAYTVDKAFELIADPSSDLTKEVYVKGLVAVAPTSNPTADGQMTYKISDTGENTGDVLTVYLGLNLNGEKFTSKNDVQQGDYVVVKGKLLDYNSTYELNKGNQLVQHVKAATISIADITMEVGETKTIAATITPAAAESAITYSIKENTANAISLSNNTITANAVGTATITATIATAAEYMGKTVEFKVTVTPKSTKEDVVILAEYNGKWYAMTNVCTDSKQMGALEVNYQNGVLYGVDEADKASITWELAIVDGKATFKNSNKYLIGSNSTTLNFANSKFEWIVEDGKYLSDSKSRTFLYNKSGIFKNYATSNAEPNQTDYSGYPVVTAPVYVNSASALTGKFSVGKYEYAEFAPGNLQYNVGTSTWAFADDQYDVIGEDNINIGDPTFTGTIDMFGWSADGKFGVNPSSNKDDYAGDFVDWGTMMGEGWETLTHDQWDYLLNKRGAGLKQIAKVGSVFGTMLFPDGWTMPSDISVTAQYDDNYEVNVYNYTLDQWTTLENAGAVFFPAAGRRFGGYGNTYRADGTTDSGSEYKIQYETNRFASYWTSTRSNDTKKVSYLFNLGNQGAYISTLELGWYEYGHAGHSVRLAKVTSTLIEIGDGNNSDVITANEGETVNVQVNRTFKANDGYYTICLPFNIDASEIGKAYQVDRIEEHVAGEGFNMVFNEVNTIEAGQPYLILPKDLTNPIFENVTIVNTTGSSVQAQGAGITFEMIGAINGGGQTEAGQYWVGEHGYFYNNDGNPRAKLGLRVYFNIKGMPAGMRARVVVGENAATDLENIFNSENTTIKVMENGQLFIIRDGVKYNAQGQRL